MSTTQKIFYETPTITVVEVHAKKAVLINASAEGVNWENPEEPEES